ncbi:MAG: hypothetical protein FD146_384 [Anaerolineaceae bacterium]|nr:MAG: hypothetical protein FD146_384 [Anaerolineaceae bacterium]
MSRFSRLAYRSRQFRRALLTTRRPVTDDLLRPRLSPAQIFLFRRMQPSEQAHAFQVYERLTAAGQTDPHLLAAALLHDAGKVLAPLSPLDRALVVLARHFLPEAARRWGSGDPCGLRRPFVTAAQHPAWGADLAAAAGASPRACGLIRRHQDVPAADDALLAALQEVDDKN